MVYSLVRKLISVAGATADTQLAGRSLFEQLLAPTRIYVKPLLALIKALPVHACAHITGGGLTDNIPRVLRTGIEAVLQRASWPRSALFDWLASTGHISDAQMYRTFNCGIGMIVIVPQALASAAVDLLRAAGEQAMVIGEVRTGERGVVIE